MKVANDGQVIFQRSGGSEEQWALLEFYRGYATQNSAELAKTKEPAPFVCAIEAYRNALPILTRSNHEKVRELKEMLGGALIAQSELPETTGASQLFREALTLNQEVVAFVRANAPAGDLAGALANLANVYATIAKSPANEDATAEYHARAALEEAVEIYREEEAADEVLNVQRQLASLGKASDKESGVAVAKASKKGRRG